MNRDEEEMEDDGDEDSPDEPGSPMESDDNPEYSIIIEYEDFLTRFDLDEILSSIDRIIESELVEYYYPEFRYLRTSYPYLFKLGLAEDSDLSYIGIKSIGSGSIELTVVAGAFVVGYVARRFKKGIDKSLFAEELERSGRLAGDILGRVLSRVNNWAQRYVPKQRELGGKVTKITARRKRSPTNRGGNEP